MAQIAQPLHRSTLAGDTFSLLRERITNGYFEPGERLIEDRLAEDLQVSRVPVREALRQLKQDGLIVYLPHRGYFVPEFNFTDLEELSLLRLAVEKLAVRLAIQRAAPEELTALEKIVQDMETIKDEDLNRARETELDTAFHEQLSRMAHSQRLLKIWGGMEDQIRMTIFALNKSFSAASGFASGHREILEAIRNGRMDQAEAALEGHISTGLENLKVSMNTAMEKKTGKS